MAIKRKRKKTPTWIKFLRFLTISIGVLISIIGISNIENYYHPYWFGLISGGLGLLFGILIALKLKPIVAANKHLKDDNYSLFLDLLILFFGLFLMTGSFINKSSPEVDKCNKYQVIDKYRQARSLRSPSINSLIVDINGESHRVICNYDFWLTTSVGQSIDLCLHNGKLGFDYISVKE